MGISGNLGRRATTGFTMLELLVVLSITAILATVAVPSVRDSLQRNSKESGMLDFMSAISLARSEAVSQSRVVTICRSTNLTACVTSAGGDWSAGWLVFTDTDAPTVVATKDAADTILKAGLATNTQSIITLKRFDNTSLATTNDFLQFDRDGSLRSYATGVYFKFCDSSNNVANARAILLSNTGRSALSTDTDPTDTDYTHNALNPASKLTCP